MVTKPWKERSRSTELIEATGSKSRPIAGVQAIPVTPPPLPGGSDFPFELVIASTAEPPREIHEYANKLVAKAFESGVFMFADTDLKYDLPQTEIVIDSDKVASLRLTLRQVGADFSTMPEGTSLIVSARPKLQGHSPGQADRASHGRSAQRHLRQRSERANGPALDLRDLEEHDRATRA